MWCIATLWMYHMLWQAWPYSIWEILQEVVCSTNSLLLPLLFLLVQILSSCLLQLLFLFLSEPTIRSHTLSTVVLILLADVIPDVECIWARREVITFANLVEHTSITSKNSVVGSGDEMQDQEVVKFKSKQSLASKWYTFIKLWHVSPWWFHFCAFQQVGAGVRDEVGRCTLVLCYKLSRDALVQAFCRNCSSQCTVSKGTQYD